MFARGIGRQPSQEAFQFRADIYRFVFARINDAEAAEDISMEVVYAIRGSEEVENLKSYMIGIARRKIADHFRESQPRGKPEKAVTRCDIGRTDEFLQVQEVLGRLTDNYQECLVLKYVCEFSSQEIAEMLGVTAGSVDNTLQRARKSFADVWNQCSGDTK